MSEAELLMKVINGLIKSGAIVRLSSNIKCAALSHLTDHMVGSVAWTTIINGQLALNIQGKRHGVRSNVELMLRDDLVCDVVVIEEDGAHVLELGSKLDPDFVV